MENRREELEDVIEDTIARGGTLLIPAFSTERTQDLIYEIRLLIQEKKVPSVPVFVDSPLASRITGSFLSCPSYFKTEIGERIAKGENIFMFDEMRFTSSRDESRRIADVKGAKIIIAGSGMSNGGRVLAHEKSLLQDEKNTLLIVGYQSAGSLGRRLLEGEKQVEIFGEKIPVRAKVAANYGYSAHRDATGLLDFVHHTSDTLEHVYVTMGEPKSAAFLTQRIRDYLGVPADAPNKGQTVELDF
jgi:metallo-beta-lactamase family protein